MEEEYITDEISEDDCNNTSSSEDDDFQDFIKNEYGLVEIKNDFESEVDKVMADHLRKLSKDQATVSSTVDIVPVAGTSKSVNDEQEKANDELFYDPNMDDDDEKWVNAHRRAYIFPNNSKSDAVGSLKPLPNSDAVLNCPACLTLLCRDCQRHELYKNQYRAMFVTNCTIVNTENLKYPKKGKKFRNRDGDSEDDFYNPVRCTVCNTEVAVYDKDEVFHFFNVLSSY